MSQKQRLELTWIGKDERPKLEPRILLEDPARSYHAKKRVTKGDLFDNRLIYGDNLLALKALEQELAGKVKCVFIDPPYNTGSAFTHYDDGLEHSIWLGLMRDRLEVIRRLMAEDGSLWITIDDTEAHYLKVLCDETFGRFNFVANVIWQKRFAPNSTAQFISDSHDHVLVYARDKSRWKRNLLPREERQNRNYKNLDDDPRGLWTSGDLSARNPYSAGIYPVTTPSGRTIPGPPKGMYWRVSLEKLKELDRDRRIWWGRSGDNVPRIKRFLSEVMEGVVPQSIWMHDEVGHTQEAKKEVMAVVHQDAEVFQTPKPERLIKRALDLSTAPGDLVLDSFAGSGTTGAVAHKMGRRWIIGGGFRYYRLAPSLLQQDRFGQWVINKSYNPEMLAAAVAKLEGFTYAPSAEVFWQHGHSTESDFIYVTTQTLNADQLQALSEEVGFQRTLLVCCGAFRLSAEAIASRFPNLTVKKIPKAVLQKCEWNHDDYSLNVANLPMAAPAGDATVQAMPRQTSLFEPAPAGDEEGR